MTAYISTAELVLAAKRALGITAPNNELTDGNIRQVTRLIGIWTNAPANMMAMLTITAIEFPEFFAKYELAETN